jgi:hypothetical protein
MVMPIVDLNDTESQSPSVIPDGVYQLEIKLRPGSAGPDGLLKVARNLRSLMLVLECIVIAEVRKSAVINSDHAKRRVWDYITVDYDESDDPDLPPIEADKLDNYKTSVRMGRARLRAILDSAYALMPNDTSDAARQKRMLDSYTALSGLRFFAEVTTRKGNGGYGPRNVIDYIITPDLPDYPKAAGTAVMPVASPKRTVADDLDDEIPF